MVDAAVPEDPARFGEDQLRRERLLDLEKRIQPYRRAAFAVLALALVASGPWEGWWWLLPLGGALAAFSVGDRLCARSPRPERWVAASWAVSPLMIALSVALTGDLHSPAIGWFALPVVTLASRFEVRGIVVGIAYNSTLLILATVHRWLAGREITAATTRVERASRPPTWWGAGSTWSMPGART